MNFLPRSIPCLSSPSCGNLARAHSTRAHSTRAGLFYTPSRVLLGGPCSLLLIRDARSVRDAGLCALAANRAVCMRNGRGRLKRCSRTGPRSTSVRFRQPSHQFGAHNANRNQPLRLGAGAAGSVLRTPPRPKVFSEVDHFAHLSFSVVPSRNRENTERTYAKTRKRIWNKGG